VRHWWEVWQLVALGWLALLAQVLLVLALLVQALHWVCQLGWLAG